MLSGSTTRTAYLLLSPALLVLGPLFVGGLLFGLAQSLGLFGVVAGRGPSLAYYTALLSSPDMARSLALTAYVAGAATAGATLLGLAVALLLRRLHRAAWPRLLAQLPLPVPHLVAAIGVGLVLAQSGLLARLLHALGLAAQPAALPPLVADRYAVGIIITYIWKEAPFVALLALAALQSMSADYERAARSLGATPWQTLRYVTLPLIAPWLLGAAVVVFAFTLGAFEVPLLLGRSYPRLLAVEAFLRYSHLDLAQRPLALAMNTLLALLTGLAVVPYLRLVRRALWAQPQAATLPARAPQARLAGAHPRRHRFALALLAVWTLLPLLPLPLLSLSAGWRWPDLLPEALSLRTWRYLLSPAARALPALASSTALALLVTALSLAAGVPAALALGRQRFSGRGVVEALIFAPILVPPLTVAMGLQVLFVRMRLSDTFVGVALVHLIFSLPYVVLILTAAIARLSPQWEQQARSLGATSLRAFLFVTLPLLRPALLAAALMAFLVSWSQYALTLLIGGGRVWTLPLLLLPAARGSDAALAAAATLLFIAPALLFLSAVARGAAGYDGGLGVP